VRQFFASGDCKPVLSKAEASRHHKAKPILRFRSSQALRRLKPVSAGGPFGFAQGMLRRMWERFLTAARHPPRKTLTRAPPPEMFRRVIYNAIDEREQVSFAIRRKGVYAGL